MVHEIPEAEDRDLLQIHLEDQESSARHSMRNQCHIAPSQWGFQATRVNRLAAGLVDKFCVTSLKRDNSFWLGCLDLCGNGSSQIAHVSNSHSHGSHTRHEGF